MPLTFLDCILFICALVSAEACLEQKAFTSKASLMTVIAWSKIVEAAVKVWSVEASLPKRWHTASAFPGLTTNE